MTALLSPQVAPPFGPAEMLAVSQESVEVLRSMCAAFGDLAQNGEIAAYVVEHFDPDCEYQPVEETGTIRGHDALISWSRRWLEAWDETWDEIDKTVVEAGELVVAAIRVHGRGRKSRMQISQRLFALFELRGGRIVRMSEYLDLHPALEAAGLSE